MQCASADGVTFAERDPYLQAEMRRVCAEMPSRPDVRRESVPPQRRDTGFLPNITTGGQQDAARQPFKRDPLALFFRTGFFETERL
jgi:hypothetical protein